MKSIKFVGLDVHAETIAVAVGSVGSGREAHGKENPRELYAVGRTEPASLVRGSSRRITIMRFRPANIRVIDRGNSRLDRNLRCLLEEGRKRKKTIARS